MVWYNGLIAAAVRREGAGSHEAGDNDSVAAEGFKDGAELKIR